jgi:transcriptional regulator with XRE-family HTH domain
MSIGERLKEFGIKKFGNVKNFAEALGIKPPSLYNYFNNKSKPGSEFLEQLMQMGCDINWLLTGVTSEDSIKKKIKDLESENQKLKSDNYKLSLEVSQLAKVAEAVEGYNSNLKNKRKG